MTEKPVAIITASGHGIGAACARELAARNYAVALMSPSGSSVELAEELGGIGINGSVTEPSDLKQLVDATMHAYGRIDAVVNNTGHTRWTNGVDPSGHIVPDADDQARTRTGRDRGLGYDPALGDSLLDVTDQDWHDGVDMFLLNVVRIARLVTPIMIRQGGGAIVNISTFAAFEPRLIFPISPTVRAALAAFVKLYADRYARDRVRMNNVLPGYMDNMSMEEEIRRAIPMGRPCTMQEISRTVAFLLSGDAGYVTGQNILVDGGINRSI